MTNQLKCHERKICARKLTFTAIDFNAILADTKLSEPIPACNASVRAFAIPNLAKVRA